MIISYYFFFKLNECSMPISMKYCVFALLCLRPKKRNYNVDIILKTKYCCPPPPHNIILFELDFEIKFPLLYPLKFLSDLKGTIFLKAISTIEKKERVRICI